MIAVVPFRTNMPNGNPWLAIGPVRNGRGEWSRVVGISLSVGKHALAIYLLNWNGWRELSGDAGNRLTAIFGRRS
jgi:hypothetical protein